MNIVFKNEISANYMIVEDIQDFSAGSYAVRILTGNRIDGLLQFDYGIMNGKTDFIYDISSKDYFMKVYEYTKIGFEDLKKLVLSLNALLKKLTEYLLDPDDVMLKKECVFVDRKTGRFEFCYFPGYGGNFMLEIRELFSGILSVVDYEDRKAVRLAYDLQKEACTDTVSFDNMIRLIGQSVGEKTEYVFENEKADYVAEERPGRSEDNGLSPDQGTTPENEGFWQKAGMYFRDNEPADIFDDINELKIIGKIRNYGNGTYEKPEKKRRKGREKKQKMTGTASSKALPAEIGLLENEYPE